MNVFLNVGAKMPTNAHGTDAGWDLYAPLDGEVIVIYPRQSAVFDTGVHFDVPESISGHVISKSGLNIRHGILSTGLVDPGYTGSVVIKLYNFGNEPFPVHPGDKISQISFVPVVDVFLKEVDNMKVFGKSERGFNGFGSSGK